MTSSTFLVSSSQLFTSSPLYVRSSTVTTSSVSIVSTPSVSTFWPLQTVLPHPLLNESKEWCTQEVFNGITWYPTLPGVVVSMLCPNSTDYRFMTRSCVAAESTAIWIASNLTSCEPSVITVDSPSWLILSTYICASITVFLLLIAVLVLVSLRYFDTSTMVVRCCLALSMIASVILFVVTFETRNHFLPSLPPHRFKSLLDYCFGGRISLLGQGFKTGGPVYTCGSCALQRTQYNFRKSRGLPRCTGPFSPCRCGQTNERRLVAALDTKGPLGEWKVVTICRLAVVGFQYWVIAQFLWLFLESVRLYIGATSRKNAVRTWVYHITGWVLPFVFVFICAVIYFEEYDELLQCFRKWYLFLCFLIPIVVITIVILFFLLFSTAQEAAFLNCSYSRSDINKPNYKRCVRKELRGTMLLFALLTSCWITSLVAIRLQSQRLQQVFAILMLLEGIAFVLIYIVFNEAVREALRPQASRPTVIEMKCESRTNRLGTNHFLPITTMTSTQRCGPTASSMGRRLSHSDTFRSATFCSHNKIGLNFRRNSFGSSTICTGDSSNTSTGVTTCDDTADSACYRRGGSMRSRTNSINFTRSEKAGKLRGERSKIHPRKQKSRNTVLEHKILQHVRVEETSSRKKRSRRNKKRCQISSDTSSSSFTNSSTQSTRTVSTNLKTKVNRFSTAKVSPSFDDSRTDQKRHVNRCLSWSKAAVSNTDSPPPVQQSLRSESGLAQCERMSKASYQAKLNQGDSGIPECERISIKPPFINKGGDSRSSKCESLPIKPGLQTLNRHGSGVSQCERISVKPLIHTYKQGETSHCENILVNPIINTNLNQCDSGNSQCERTLCKPLIHTMRSEIGSQSQRISVKDNIKPTPHNMQGALHLTSSNSRPSSNNPPSTGSTIRISMTQETNSD
ncbi:uncharacterized protein [Antedon mediterranea]|uniref:uncharacterized protein n=1 Tax=Antedon mediterranea TaxID=105859 RepID=UPI003AF77D3D